ncbi:MAG: glucose-6-phosphate dehydrogenase assembly protein OpcA [Candidatus Limnocylindrales bacterium]
MAKNLKVAGPAKATGGAGAKSAAAAGALPVAHSVAEIERQLASLWARAEAARAKAALAELAVAEAQALAAAQAAAALATREPGGAGERHVVARSSVLNLIVVAGSPETAERCAATIAGIAGRRPSRSLILAAMDPDGPPGLDARIEALALTTATGRAETGAETIHVSARGETGMHLASIIVPLLVRDLPVALWWPDDPQFSSRRADRLMPLADRLIVDGSSWSGDGLDRLAALARLAQDRRLLVADFALLRQARWREALASVYDLPDLRPHLRAVRRIAVEYATGDELDPSGSTNVVRPVYHVAWLASRLGMGVASPLRRVDGGRRVATLRQLDHKVEVELRPASSHLGVGSTVRVEIVSRLRGAELVGDVAAGDRTVEVAVRDKGRERVRRTYLAPRLRDVDLLEGAVVESATDPVAVETLAMAGRLIGAVPPSRDHG